MWLFENANYDFIGKRFYAYALSAIVIIGSWFYGYFIKKPRFGIDFTGGALVQVEVTKDITLDDLRGVLSKDIKHLVVQEYGKAENQYLLRVPAEGNLNELVDKIKNVLKKNFGSKVKILKVEVIGPSVGKELREKGIAAVLLSFLAILAYVAWRFELVYAVTSVLALVHDTLVTVGMIMVTGREFSLPVIAAILTVIGYSINDTIVVFDRIRENLQIYKSAKPFEVLVNESINQTLSRTVITSLTTFFVVLCLFLFGGGSINDFAFALLVGIITGTYSSIFIASALVIDWFNIKRFFKKS